jgi:hypothetical protein
MDCYVSQIWVPLKPGNMTMQYTGEMANWLVNTC